MAYPEMPISARPFSGIYFHPESCYLTVNYDRDTVIITS